LGRAIALRSIAWELAAISGRPGIPILSGFETPYYQYYGNLLGTGGLYWDNAAGLHAAADFFADYGELKAEQVVRSRGLKYVLVDTRPNVIADWSYCQYGMMGGDGIGMTLGSRLATRHDPPAWLRQVNPRAVPVASRFGFKIYAVTLK
jgi:hypothetical protein